MTNTDWLFSLNELEARLPDEQSPMRFAYALRHGTMKVGLYAPVGEDTQGPHQQDELYIVIAGTGRFRKNGELLPFKKHDVIFVEAGAEHRFEDFSPDFSAWVIFWGAEGGET